MQSVKGVNPFQRGQCDIKQMLLKKNSSTYKEFNMLHLYGLFSAQNLGFQHYNINFKAA